VLRDGELSDQRELLNGDELVELWSSLYLPVHIRTAWQSLIDAATPTRQNRSATSGS
jgi:hypothetical protein